MVDVDVHPLLKRGGDWIIQKEKSYVVDYHCNSSHPVAAWLSWSEHQPKVPANGGWIHTLIVVAVILVILHLLGVL